MPMLPKLGALPPIVTETRPYVAPATFVVSARRDGATAPKALMCALLGSFDVGGNLGYDRFWLRIWMHHNPRRGPLLCAHHVIGLIHSVLE